MWLAFLLAALVVATTGASARPHRPAVVGVVNINTAKAVELILLPGIGPAKAGAIIASRSRSPFLKPNDLFRIKGIGARTYGRLRKFIVVSGKTTARRPLAPAPGVTPKLTP